jgi:hypothetical protein
MKHNLIQYDITFFNVNVKSIINVFESYGLKCHCFQYDLITLLLSC